jgi:hypothetical protein
MNFSTCGVMGAVRTIRIFAAGSDMAESGQEEVGNEIM